MSKKSKKNQTLFTIGTDPEFFLRNSEAKLISAIPYIKGTKHHPEKLSNGGTLQYDNVAVEVSTAPADSAQSFVDYIRDTLSIAKSKLPENCDIVAMPSASFDESELEDPAAKEFGCDPDFCVWDRCENEKPCVDDPTFRSCGGHVHCGHKILEDFENKERMVRAMDITLGIISTVLDSSEASIKRRELYGKAGCFRFTDYGIEYRTLSNYWLKSPITAMLIHSLTEDALNLVMQNKEQDLVNAIGEDAIRSTINNGDVESAKQIIGKHISPVLSTNSKDLFMAALDKIGVDTNLFEEWGIQGAAAC